jgi:hypothetical protein
MFQASALSEVGHGIIVHQVLQLRSTFFDSCHNSLHIGTTDGRSSVFSNTKVSYITDITL